MNPEDRRLTRRRVTRLASLRRIEGRKGKRRCPATQKTRFVDFDQAVGAAVRLSSTLGRPIRAYPCDACAGWHLTRRKTPPEGTTT